MEPLRETELYQTLKANVRAGPKSRIYEEAQKLFLLWTNKAAKGEVPPCAVRLSDAGSAIFKRSDTHGPRHCQDGDRQSTQQPGVVRRPHQKVLPHQRRHPLVGIATSNADSMETMPFAAHGSCGYHKPHLASGAGTMKKSTAISNAGASERAWQLASTSASHATSSAFGATFGVKSEGEALAIATCKPFQAQGAQQLVLGTLEARLGALKKKDELSQKAQELTGVNVTLFHCRNCQTKSIKLRKACREHGHRFDTITQKMRFFGCKRCGTIQRLIGERLPSKGCITSLAGPELFAECAERQERLAMTPADEFHPRGEEYSKFR